MLHPRETRRLISVACCVVLLPLAALASDLASLALVFKHGSENVVRLERKSLGGLEGAATIALDKVSPQGVETHESRTIETGHDAATFALGPLLAPPEYEFEAGVVYQRGYGLRVGVWQDGRQRASWTFQQVQGPGPDIRLERDAPRREVFQPLDGEPPALSLRLAPEVLRDQDELAALIELRPGSAIESVTGELHITDAEGLKVWRREVQLAPSDEPFRLKVEGASAWPSGDYRVELRPRLGGRLWSDGPALVYRRRDRDPDELRVAPLANWTLRRDPIRKELHIRDLRGAFEEWGVGEVAPDVWKWRESGHGAVALESIGDFDGREVAFRLPTKGYYAVFAGVEDSGVHLQIHEDDIVRPIPPKQIEPETFVAAADLSGETLRIFPGGDASKWLDGQKLGAPPSRVTSLRFVPVTAESAEKLRVALAEPPRRLIAINDWADLFGAPWSRLMPDQFDAMVCGQQEVGLSVMGWSIGRSCLEYHSELPDSSLYPCAPFEKTKSEVDFAAYDYRRRSIMIQKWDPLDEAIRAGARCNAEVWPWLAMQRHYGADAYGGMFASKFFASHPEWRRISKTGKDSVGLSFFFPEVRRERVQILMETARRGSDGLLVGCDRQTPMLLYNPEMTAAYEREFGVDPRTLDVHDGEAYERWIRWRADFFTEVLRELKREAVAYEADNGRKLPIIVRLPSTGLFHNLAEGLDIEQWAKEELIDGLDLDPLEQMGGKSDQDVRPYVEIGRQYGFDVYGGMGATGFIGKGGETAWVQSSKPDLAGPRGLVHLIAGLKRARGLLRAGVDGINVYESELLAQADPIRFLVALYGHPARLEQLLRNSNLEAVAPVDAGNATAGFDNHSRWTPGWTLEGSGDKSL